MVTKPFKLDGTKLLVNLDASGGEVRIEIVDESAKPIANYSGEHSAVARDVDQLRWSALWGSTDDLSSLDGKIVRLKFSLRNAKVYAFQFH